MKIISVILSVSLLIITAILIFLVKKGTALRPAGVIKPAEMTSDSTRIGKAIALRLFPDFHAAQNVIWYLENEDEIFSSLPSITHSNYQNPQKPELHDLRKTTNESCAKGCWYILKAGTALPESLVQKMKSEPTLEIFVQSFNRQEPVPEKCENQKVLETECVKPVSVREVRRKIKTTAPVFFMQRYKDSQFYLFIEK